MEDIQNDKAPAKTAKAAKAEEKKTDKAMAQMRNSTVELLGKEQKVRVSIPKPQGATGLDASDVIVGINGYNYQIKRGAPVDVPAPVEALLREAGYI